MINKKLIFNSIVFYFFVLFFYAAYVKGSDRSLFIQQMNQSPLLPEFLLDFISIIIPLIEIIICILLVIKSTRLLGILLSFTLMSIFTIYLIFLVTAYTYNIPCACGGILGNLGYPIHISFNLFSTVLAFIAIKIYK